MRDVKAPPPLCYQCSTCTFPLKQSVFNVIARIQLPIVWKSLAFLLLQGWSNTAAWKQSERARGEGKHRQTDREREREREGGREREVLKRTVPFPTVETSTQRKRGGLLIWACADRFSGPILSPQTHCYYSIPGHGPAAIHEPVKSAPFPPLLQSTTATYLVAFLCFRAGTAVRFARVAWAGAAALATRAASLGCAAFVYEGTEAVREDSAGPYASCWAGEILCALACWLLQNKHQKRSLSVRPSFLPPSSPMQLTEYRL